MRRVAITGANGNLGRKIIDRLLESGVDHIVAIDQQFSRNRSSTDDERIEHVSADLREPAGRWNQALAGVEGVVHFAAQNPYPDASWSDCVASADMTIALAEAAIRQGVGRFVFASSNHVMGGYKAIARGWKPGGLGTDLPPMPGTRWSVGGVIQDSPAYAVAKLMGERILAMRAATSKLTAVSLRIGWCQPGENDPRTINPAGLPGKERTEPVDPDTARSLGWFRHMWLSNRDFCSAVTKALKADASAWPAPAIVVNAMSANRLMPWDIETACRLTGYVPEDDIWSALGLEPPAPAQDALL